MARKPSSRPERAFVRAEVPVEVSDTVGRIARLLRVPKPFAYTLILTRELWNVDAKEYAIGLLKDFTNMEGNDVD